MTRTAAVAALTSLFLLPAGLAVAEEGEVPAVGAAQSFYCVTTTPIYYEGRQVWPGSSYCVPGP